LHPGDGSNLSFDLTLHVEGRRLPGDEGLLGRDFKPFRHDDQIRSQARLPHLQTGLNAAQNEGDGEEQAGGECNAQADENGTVRFPAQVLISEANKAVGIHYLASSHSHLRFWSPATPQSHHKDDTTEN
jgi:hypothetical protein